MNQETKVKIKLIVGICTVIISIILGVYTKFVFFLRLPTYFDWWAFFFYILSWVMLFVAAFFVGKEALLLATAWVKKKMQKTYDVTTALPKKGIQQGLKATKILQKETIKQGKRFKKATFKH